MLRKLSRVLRACLALAVLGAGLIVGTAGTAAAEEAAPSWTETYTINFGNTGVEIGSATVSRYDGTLEDTIVVAYEIEGGYTESHLCTSPTPFTDRIEPGQCQHKNEDPEGDGGNYTLTVGPAEVIYLQLHIAAQQQTAYMGWVQGPPAYGNVHVPNVVTCPTGYTAPDVDMIDADKNGVAENCDFTAVPAACPSPLVPPVGGTAMDSTGDGIADNCVAAQVVTCPSGYAPPAGEMADTTGDGRPDNCDFIPVAVNCPSPLVPPVGGTAMDSTGDGIADNCVAAQVVNCPTGQTMVDGQCKSPDVINVPVVLPDTCPDGSVMTDVNKDGKVTAADCAKVLPDTATPIPATPATPATPAVPATPGTPATPAVPAEPVPSVLPDAATPTVVPVAAAPAVAETAVLGAQVQRAPLARTGSSSTGLAAFGALLVLLGASASLAGRRTARSC